MTTLGIYLTFDGNCEEAFSFYKSVFGGEYESFQRFRYMPPQDGAPSMTEETDTLFNALAQGGKVTVPLEKTFWGSYFGMLTDKFGISWMVDCNLENHK